MTRVNKTTEAMMKPCTCYDDGVMCVTPRDCPKHGAARTKEVE